MTQTDCRGLRVLLVGPYPPPFGGIASHLTMLVPGLHARGAADVAIVSFGDRDAVEAIEGGTLYRVETRRHLWRLASPRNWRIAAETARTFRGGRLGFHRSLAEATRAALLQEIAARRRSEVISFYQSDQSLALLPCATVWGSRRGTVLTVLGECYDTPRFFLERRELAHRLIARPHAVVSSSKHCARSFDQVGVTRNIEAVYYGIDLQRFATGELRPAYRAELSVADGEVLVTYMGRFSEEMGLGRVLEAGATLLGRLPRVKLLLAGAKGPLADVAASFAREHAGKVRVLHDVPFSLQPSIYAASDVVLAPSADQHACMGMSIKEAMAASRPVIGSDAGGIPEAIVDGESGILVPLDETKHVDAGLLLTAIERLANDAELRDRIGAAARRRAEELFSTERTIDRMAELFMAARPK